MEGSCEPWYFSVLAVTLVEFLVAVAVAVAFWNAGCRWVSAAALVVAASAVFQAAVPVGYGVPGGRRSAGHGARRTERRSALAARCAALAAEVAAAAALARVYLLGRADRGAWVGVGAFVAAVVAAQGFGTAGVVTSLGWTFAMEDTLRVLAGVALTIPTARLIADGGRARTFGIVMAVLLVPFLALEVALTQARWAGRLGSDDDDRHDEANTRTCGGWGGVHVLWSVAYFIGLAALCIYLQTCPTS